MKKKGGAEKLGGEGGREQKAYLYSNILMKKLISFFLK